MLNAAVVAPTPSDSSNTAIVAKPYWFRRRGASDVREMGKFCMGLCAARLGGRRVAGLHPFNSWMRRRGGWFTRIENPCADRLTRYGTGSAGSGRLDIILREGADCFAVPTLRSQLM